MEDFEPTTFEAPPSLQPSRAHSPKTRRSSVAAEPAFDRNQSLTSRHEAAALRREQLQAARAAGIAAKSTAARKKMAAPPVIVENPDVLILYILTNWIDFLRVDMHDRYWFVCHLFNPLMNF
jgi:hypothetical protein